MTNWFKLSGEDQAAIRLAAVKKRLAIADVIVNQPMNIIAVLLQRMGGSRTHIAFLKANPNYNSGMAGLWWWRLQVPDLITLIHKERERMSGNGLANV